MPSNVLRTAALLAALLPTWVLAAPVDPQPARPKVQLALLLDNSGSMQGLINQARAQLWRIVNELSTAQRNGQKVILEVALYEYGENPRRLTGFTRDLDKVSELLFGLDIRGGDEYCGEVIQKATRDLEWSPNPNDLKLIYIAGNEPFTQGPVTPASAIRDASRRGILVNTIHCGGNEPTWREGARLAGGQYLTINQNAVVAHIAAPQDQELARLGAELNKTYVGYGAMGRKRAERQVAQDQAAAAMGAGTAVSRSAAKASALYTNEDWDLVDAAKKAPAAVATMKADDLPEEMKPMSVSEREAYVEKKTQERTALQKKIAELNEQRNKYVAEERKKQAKGGDATLDEAIIQSIRVQAAQKALTF